MRRAALILLCLAMLGCNGSSAVGPDPALSVVRAFVESQHRAFVRDQTLPKAQEIVEILRVPEEDLLVFSVNYGDPQDCWAGCFYSVGYGLKYGSTIGWMRVENYGMAVDSARLVFYETSPTDHYLFTGDLFRRLQAAHHWIGENGLLHMLVRSPHTPETTLLQIARGDYTPLHNYVAELLTQNPVVQRSREILTVLANLPVLQGDPYGTARRRAQNLLQRLNA